MAINRPSLRDVIPKREVSVSEKARLKSGRPRDRLYARKIGDTFTVSFTVTQEIDALIDRHARERNVSRSSIIRQAMLLADLNWAKHW